MDDLIVLRPQGLYCPRGDFYIDPWRPVSKAVITHAHADHARRGHDHYLAHRDCAGLLKARLGDVSVQPLEYGHPLQIGDVKVCLYPAGHVLGSAQVSVAHQGRVWVVSGDYFLSGADPSQGSLHGSSLASSSRPSGRGVTCEPFEPVRCECFITESTFGMPVYRWRPHQEVLQDIQAWWQHNAQQRRSSVLLAYSLGKAQRVLGGLDPQAGPVVVHPSIEPLNEVYRACGVALPTTLSWPALQDADVRSKALVLMPPSAQTQSLQRLLGDYSDAFASGWMQLRGARQRQGVDRGFVLSDHADWPGLQRAIAATQAQRVLVTHGYESVMVKWLQQQGLQADALKTLFADEASDA